MPQSRHLRVSCDCLPCPPFYPPAHEKAPSRLRRDLGGYWNGAQSSAYFSICPRKRLLLGRGSDLRIVLHDGRVAAAALVNAVRGSWGARVGQDERQVLIAA